jgi:hypothetical protein
MDDCLQQLTDRVDAGEGEQLKTLILTERLARLIRMRLEMQAPYISKWPQALSIQVVHCLLFFPMSLTKLCDSYMSNYIICLAVPTGKRLHKLEAESGPC